jgi:hypothetical protein
MRLTFLATIVVPCMMTAMQATTVDAQSIPSPYTFIDRKQEAGPYVGYMSASTGRFGYGPKGGLMLGGRWGLELSGPVSVEGVVGVLDGERDVIDPARAEGQRVIGQADVLLSMFDARLKFSFPGSRAWHSLSPFIVLGGGVAFDLAAESALDASLDAADQFNFGTSFFGTAGAGTRWFLSDAIALRVDGVFSLYKVDTPPGFSDPVRGFLAVEEGQWLQALSITVSALIRW